MKITNSDVTVICNNKKKIMSPFDVHHRWIKFADWIIEFLRKTLPNKGIEMFPVPFEIYDIGKIFANDSEGYIILVVKEFNFEWFIEGH